MKRNILVASEFELVHDCYRSFSINILATPKNFVIRHFIDSEYNTFRVINREDSDMIELRSHVGGSTYVDKQSIRAAFDLNKHFVMVLKNSNHKIVIPKPNLEWLFGTGREDIKWNPVYEKMGQFNLEFEDKFESTFTLSQLAYFQHPRVQDMADVFPF
jgi:hypothetical protein